MANRYPLIADKDSQEIKELPTGDNLDLTGNNISSVRNIVPESNELYDLGSPNNRWKDLYLSGNSIVLGDGIISYDSVNQFTISAVNESSGEPTVIGTLIATGDTPSFAGMTLTGPLSMGGTNKITDLANPINTSDAATKLYVDEVAQGLQARSAADILVEDELDVDYDNGSGNDGIGATLTAKVDGAFPEIDDVTLDTAGSRVLVIGQTNKAHNGLYVLDVVGDASEPWVLRRCVECDEPEEIIGSFVFIRLGTQYANTGWVAIVDSPESFQVGVNDINWIQFSGAGSLIAGTGLTLTGNTLDVEANLSHVTELGTITSGTWNATTIAVNKGGTGQLSYTNGELLIGNSTGNTLTKATLIAGSNITVDNGPGSITIAGASTNLSITAGTTAGPIINSSTGTNVTIPSASSTSSGIVTTGAQIFAGAKTFSDTIGGSISGNATTATTLQTTRQINGTNFNGSADITITANTPNAITFNSAGNGAPSNTTFNGSSAVTISYDTVGAPSATGVGASGTWSIDVTGNAGTATTLETTRQINGTSFNGSVDITTANWGTSRTLTIGSTGKLVNGSENVNWTLSDIGVNDSTLTLAASGIATGSQTWTSNQGTNATFTVDVPGTDVSEGTRTATTVPITSSTGTGATLNPATTSVAGMMTSADKTKLDGIAAGAQANTVTSVAGKTGAVTLTNSDVGLDNVTNHAQVRKLASSTTGNVPVWDGTTGDQLSNGYGVETVLNGSSSNLARADAIKSYVDEVAQGLKAVESAFVLLNTNISATYNADGHEPGWATLTSTTNGAFPSVDDVSSNDLNVVGVRILITGQTNAAHNGIYVLKTPGDGSTPWVLRRCQQCYQSSQLPGTFVFVKLGTTYANTGWVATVADVTTFVIGVDDIIYVQFSGAGTFTAGTGLTLTGTEFSVNSSLPHVTEVGTITAGTWNASTIAVNRGGTGQLSYTNGELLIGNSTGSTLTKATLTAGTNISITNGSGSITINAASTNIAEGTRTTTTVPITSSTGSNATLSAATTTLAGVMTSADKTKLDGIAAGAQVNVATNLTYSTATTTGTVNSSTGTNATIPAATTALAGLMSSADKTKLDGIAAGAQATSIVNGTSSVSVVSSGGDTVVTRAESTHSTFNNQGIVLSTGVFVGDLDGNAASANYADLAEKYTAIDGIVPGTVVTVCSHPDHELEACTETAFPVGVVSTQPAFLMNSNLENGVAIALKGRVPTRVVGAVNKGDLLFAGANGCAVKNGVYKVAVALESNNDEGEKLVECMLVV